MKLPSYLTKEIHLPEMDELKVLALVVAMIAVSVFTVDRFVGISHIGEAAMYSPLPAKTLKTVPTLKRAAPVKKTDAKTSRPAAKAAAKSSAASTNCTSRAAKLRNAKCQTNAGESIKVRTQLRTR